MTGNLQHDQIPEAALAWCEAGERVAIAGVSFLRDGMPVKLLPAED